MNNGGRIPTPWSHRWRRMRYSMLPVVSFCVCLAVTLWLWHRQGQLPHAVGEVEVVRMDVASGVDGRLLPLSVVRPAWTLLDTVQEGQVIARLDAEALKAQVAALQAGVERLEKELDAEAAKLVRRRERPGTVAFPRGRAPAMRTRTTPAGSPEAEDLDRGGPRRTAAARNGPGDHEAAPREEHGIGA